MMNSKGIVPVILLLVGLGFLLLVGLYGIQGAVETGVCDYIRSQNDAEGIMCSNQLAELYSQARGKYEGPLDQILHVTCRYGTGLMPRHYLDLDVVEDCQANGKTCTDMDADENPVDPFCDPRDDDSAGQDIKDIFTTDLGPVSSCEQVNSESVFAGAFKASDGAAYQVCVVRGQTGLKAIASRNAVCPADFELLKEFVGADEANHFICIQKGGAGVADIQMVPTDSGQTCPSEYETLETLVNTQDVPVLWCVKQSGEIPVEPVCECADATVALCGTDLWENIAPECQTVCPAQFGTAPCSQTEICDITQSPPACLSQADFDCGVPMGESGLSGTNCPQGDVCDLESGSCVNIETAANYPKYEFDLFSQFDEAWALNACFAYSTGAETIKQQNDLLHISRGRQGTSDFSFNLLTQKLTAGLGRGGVLPFVVSNESLSGPYNYALLEVRDGVAASDGAPQPKAEKMVIKLRARQGDVCYSEENLEGRTGPDAVPRVKYNWSFDDATGIAADGCDEKRITGAPNSEYFYCDATQFSIELSKKLSAIITAAENNAPVPSDSPLLDFNAYLLPDGYSQDFRLDFDFLQSNAEFFTGNERYQQIAPYFINSQRLVLPARVNAPGKYRVQLSIGFPSGKSNVFFENNAPIATVFVSMELLERQNSQNPLYYMPLDYAVGTLARSGESAPNRQGYGVALDQPVRASAQTTIPALENAAAGTQVSVSRETEVVQLSQMSKRGIVLDIVRPTQNQGGTLIWSPVRATPVALTIPMNNNTAQAFVELISGASAVNLGDAPIALWTQIGSTAGDACRDFAGQKALYNAPEPLRGQAGNCAQTSPNARGFFWSQTNALQDSRVYYYGVVYSPVGQFSLRKPDACAPAFDIITPREQTSASQNLVGLDTVAAFSLETESLTEVLSKVSNRQMCVFDYDQGAVFFWNRNRALDVLVNPQNYSPVPAFDLSDLPQLTDATKCLPVQ